MKEIDNGKKAPQKQTRRKRPRKPNLFLYRLTQVICWFVARLIFRRKVLRNEIRGRKGPFVVIANHQAQLDFVNLIGMTATPMTFVISDSFYKTLPVKGILTALGVIPKQQFQTSISDIKSMKWAVDHGRALVIYPAGLMCEDGLSTPIPAATYQFLKWLGADVYMARTTGTYFAMPKWAKNMRPGRTYMDVYRLFSHDELMAADLETVRKKTEAAMLFDAYREQERKLVKYHGNDDIRGLENVLYACPHCHREFTIQVKEKNTICCTACGFEQISDHYAFLHNWGDVGEEIRYVSDWSRLIYDRLRERVERGEETELSAETAFHMVDRKRHKYVEVGRGEITLTPEGFRMRGELRNKPFDQTVSIACFASLPFSPGRYLEIQHGGETYRCVLKDGRAVMKFINLVKIYYELHSAVKDRC